MFNEIVVEEVSSKNQALPTESATWCHSCHHCHHCHSCHHCHHCHR